MSGKVGFAGVMVEIPESNVCACGHRRRDHRIEGPPGCALSEIRWFECEVCGCTQFDSQDSPQ